MAAADVCWAAAGQAGKLWKRYRKILPPTSRSLLAEFLLDLRLHVLPYSLLDSVSNVGRARYDARGIAELLSYLAQTPTPLHPPHPPPPLPELDGAIMCSTLEASMRVVYGAAYSGEVPGTTRGSTAANSEAANGAISPNSGIANSWITSGITSANCAITSANTFEEPPVGLPVPTVGVPCEVTSPNSGITCGITSEEPIVSANNAITRAITSANIGITSDHECQQWNYHFVN